MANMYEKILNDITANNSPDYDYQENEQVIFVTGAGNCPFMQNKELHRTRCGHCAQIKDKTQFHLMRNPAVVYDFSNCLANYESWTPAQKQQWNDGVIDLRNKKRGIL